MTWLNLKYLDSGLQITDSYVDLIFQTTPKINADM